MPQSPAEFVHREYTHHTGNIGAPGLGWQREPDPSALSTAELVASRAYAFDLETQPVEEFVAGCSELLRRYGFAVVDHVVPRGSVADVRRELSEGTEQALAAMSPEERTRPGLNGSKRDVNQLVLQPLFAQHVCHPAVVGIARSALDAHVRITATGTRNFSGGFGPEANRGPLGREWHTGASRHPSSSVYRSVSHVCMLGALKASAAWGRLASRPLSGHKRCDATALPRRRHVHLDGLVHERDDSRHGRHMGSARVTP